jgi:type I restriction enzyme S subunit
LDEKRSALITQAVTKGLDPTAPMRDSGIEWIGEIPEGWKVAALKRLCSLSANYGLNVTGNDYRTSGVRLLRTSDIEESGLLKDEGDAVYVDPARATGMTLEHGDILLSRSGTLGRCLRFRDQGAACTFAAYLVRFRVSSDQLDNYVEYCSRAKFFSAQIEVDAIQSTIANFNGQKYGDINMPIPPLAEQRAIADFLDHETTRIDQLKSLNRRQIELLKEKRQALITAAVTGRIPEARGVA